MRIQVEGHVALTGNYTPSGNPNAAQTLIAAALIADQSSELHNIPRTLGTEAMFSLAESMGAVLTWQDDTALHIDPANITRRVLSQPETDATLGVLLLIPALLIRRGHARLEIDFPLNRIRTHLEALRDLGMDVVMLDSAVELKATTWDHKAIILTQMSVTATALVMMLSARLGKETIIHNAASEPHLQQLGVFLQMMGATIEGIGSNTLRIFGVETLKGAEIAIGADHIEAASIAAIAAMLGGRVQIHGVNTPDLRLIRKIYTGLGIGLELDDTDIFIPKHETLMLSNREEDVDASIETAPWPGFPSDLISIATVIATQARGTSLIHEKLFNNRLLFIDKLKAMGAQIVLCDPHRAIVIGATPLRGIYMDSPDVRTGLGMLAAALVAEGVSTLDNAQALDQTFAGVLPKLQGLNARITVE